MRHLEEQLAGTYRERDEIQAELARNNSGVRNKRGRIERAYDESVRCLAPSLEFVNEDSVDALANRFETCESVLMLLHKLDSEPGQVEWKSVKGTKGWREACDHFRTGRSKGMANDGRLYFRKQNGVGAYKYLVHISRKSLQNKDIELLKKRVS